MIMAWAKHVTFQDCFLISKMHKNELYFPWKYGHDWTQPNTIRYAANGSTFLYNMMYIATVNWPD